jgi:ATP-binding cassette subfamily B protein
MPAAQEADRLLLRTARRGGWWLVLLGCASLAEALVEVLLPAAIGYAVDGIITPGDDPAPWLIRCALLVAVIIAAAGATQLAAGTATATATAWLRGLLVSHIIACGPGSRFESGDSVSRVVGGTAEAGGAPSSVVMAITSVITPVGSVVALGLIDPWLVVAFAAGFPVLIVVLRAFVRDSSDVSMAYQRAQGAIAARLLDALAGARTIAAAGTQDMERRRILGPLPDLRRHGEASWRVQARASAQGMAIGPAMQAVVLAVAGFLLARHRITPGGLIAASQYAALAVGVGAAIGQLNRLGRARGGARRSAQLLSQTPLGYGARELPPGTGELRFRSVTARQVLHGLDLTIPGGSSVAVVGRSGAGKSTLAALAGRLTDPSEGVVTLDGCDLRQLTRSALRASIVYAFERPALFGETPLEAISFGTWRPPHAEILSAASSSGAATFIERRPGGMLAPLNALTLSGGEIQRLGLARAFAHAGRARLLILDDATSSLDTATEMLVSQALADRMSDRTRLIVAHRATTAARADLVAWLDDGRVRALAPHAELWAEPDYRAVFSCLSGT